MLSGTAACATGTELSDQAAVKDSQQQGEVVEAIVVPPDLPLAAIAEEVKHSWRLKVWCRPPLAMNQSRCCCLLHLSQSFHCSDVMQEVQVEQLLERAVAKSERPWLILLSALTAGSILLLLLVFYKLHLMAY